MSDETMLDTDFLFQPRGAGTGWCFRMRTPEQLIGFLNPRTEKPYGKEIRIGLRTRSLLDARKKRDIILGHIRAQAEKTRAEAEGDMETALQIAEELKRIEDPETLESVELELSDRAEAIEQSQGLGAARAWYRAATGKETPLSAVYQRYVEDAGANLSKSSQLNLETAWRDFQAFLGADLSIESVDRRVVANFVTVYLPKQTTPRSPSGPSPATIAKKVSLLKGIWTWAMKRGVIPMEPMTPWDKQAPEKRRIKAATKKRRPFEPHEVQLLFAAQPTETVLGDVIRIALLTGVRLSEIININASWVGKDGAGYTVPAGYKSESASRYVPLVGPAREVIERRVANAGEDGALFPERTKRSSDGKKSPAVSSAFTRLRRKVLGDRTDGELAEHSFRHTWRTAARRADVDLRTSSELGGWSRGESVDTIYDHGLELERYQRSQLNIYNWYKSNGYLNSPEND